jgi:hypothetical protein
MEPVDNIAQVMQILRRQMSENLEKLRRAGKISTHEKPALGLSGERIQSTSRQTIARRIKSIEADDPGLLEKATHIFVESILLAEFGGGLVNDPEFQDLVHQVQEAMLADPSIEQDLRRLAGELRSE